MHAVNLTLMWGLFIPMTVVEAVALVRRHLRVPGSPTISMSLRAARYHTTALIFFWVSMPWHWWWPWAPATTAGSVAYWCLALGLLAWDVAWRKKPLEEFPRWARWAKDSRLWLLVSPPLGLVLFPQGA